MPQRPPWPAATFASPLLLLAMQGCASTMSRPDQAYPPPGHLPPTANRIEDGPLRFWGHNLGIYCFSVWGCEVHYGDDRVYYDEPDVRAKPLSSYPVDLSSRMEGSRIGLKNFEGPLVARWRDSKGTPRRVEFDLSEIFADGLIRHRVPRELIKPGVSIHAPDIILEINDNEARLYMRAHIPLAKPSDPRNPHSDFVEENVLVREVVGDEVAP